MTVVSPFGAGFLDPPAPDFGATPTASFKQPRRSIRTNAGVRVVRAVAETTAEWTAGWAAAAASGLVPVALLLQLLGPLGAVTEPARARGTKAHVQADQANLPATPAAWTQEQLEMLAETDPARFLTVIGSGEVEPTVLTFAAEHAGRLRDVPAAVAVLGRLLEHAKSYVREGALLGLACAGSADAVARIHKAATQDPSQGIRRIASELLEHLEA